MDDDYDGNSIQCSYCGKWLYADAAMCPKCSNYTDGLGPLARPERAGEEERRPIPKIFVIAGWLVLFALLIPVILMVIGHFSSR